MHAIMNNDFCPLINKMTTIKSGGTDLEYLKVWL